MSDDIERPGAAAWVPGYDDREPRAAVAAQTAAGAAVASRPAAAPAEAAAGEAGEMATSGPGTATSGPGAATPGPASIAALREAAPSCRGCELQQHATQVVFSAGPQTATLMLVGEQPGDREDIEGRPFVGPAGRLLADAVTKAGIDRGALYVTNAVKHFRFEERGPRRIHKTPAVGHVIACHPWLEAEVDAIAPQVILCLGATAARSVLGRTASVTRERGQLLQAPDVAARLGHDVKVLLTNHPSAVLRLRGEPTFDEAFAALVADLRLAASHLR